MEIIDTHCHLDSDIFRPGVPQLIHDAGKKRVIAFVVPGYIGSNWERIFTLAAQHRNVYPAPGLHPLYLSRHQSDDLTTLDRLCTQKNPVAIGEVGLDFYHGNTDATQQHELFCHQIAIAIKHKLPLLLHVRKAHDTVLSILRKTKFTNGGIVHAFSGSRQQAEQYIALGFKLGYGGNITYSRATRIRQLATELPLSAIVLETDAPDMPLQNYRHEKNSPLHLPEILETLAHLRGLSKEEVARQTTENVKEVLPRLEQI